MFRIKRLTNIWKSQNPIVTLKHKVLFMQEVKPPIETLQDIKKMMERSSRFISLSGWSGVSAGLCALAGALVAQGKLATYRSSTESGIDMTGIGLINYLVGLAAVVFAAAFVSAFFFTYIRSRKNNTPIWDPVSRRLMWNVLIPLAAGGICVLKVLQEGYYDLIGPLCLVFYGLSLLNASKYTLGEIRYLGFGQLILGIISLWTPGYGLYFWAAGFGILHILYGLIMWWRYER